MSGSSQEKLKAPVRVTLLFASLRAGATVALVLITVALFATPDARPAAAQGTPQKTAADTAFPVLRALYLNRFAAQSGPKLRKLLAMADSTEINAFVIDMKDEFGLNFRSSNPKVQRNAGAYGSVRFVQALVDTLKAHGIAPIARVVTFKDPVAAALNPAWDILQEDSTIWHDKKGDAWVSPFNPEVWEYNLAVAEELARYGFAEIQFDYVRFPEPFASLPKQVFPHAAGRSKPEVLAAFLTQAKARLAPLGVRTTADVFGATATARGTLEVGQNWERLSAVVDVILPMVYPSHYPRGFYGLPVPNADPYAIVKMSLDTARARDWTISERRPEHVRPWLQAFTLGKPAYGAEEVKAQMRAVYEAGYNGWVLWHPGSNYDLFAAALAPKDSSRPR
jgi:hypothetical protein